MSRPEDVPVWMANKENICSNPGTTGINLQKLSKVSLGVLLELDYFTMYNLFND